MTFLLFLFFAASSTGSPLASIVSYIVACCLGIGLTRYEDGERTGHACIHRSLLYTCHDRSRKEYFNGISVWSMDLRAEEAQYSIPLPVVGNSHGGLSSDAETRGSATNRCAILPIHLSTLGQVPSCELYLHSFTDCYLFRTCLCARNIPEWPYFTSRDHKLLPPARS